MQLSAKEMHDALQQRAVEDSEFRAELLADPKGIVNREYGVEIPDSIDIKVHDSDLNTIHLSLPPQEQLTEEQLRAISAGLSSGCG